jgi:phosphopantothenoylcysteine synthetase/decarboxylase
LVLFDEHGHVALPAAHKRDLARELIAEIARRLPA